MRKAHLVAFCMAVIGTYGILYAIHVARGARDASYHLSSRLDDSESTVGELNDEIEELRSRLIQLEFMRY